MIFLEWLSSLHKIFYIECSSYLDINDPLHTFFIYSSNSKLTITIIQVFYSQKKTISISKFRLAGTGVYPSEAFVQCAEWISICQPTFKYIFGLLD